MMKILRYVTTYLTSMCSSAQSTQPSTQYNEIQLLDEVPDDDKDLPFITLNKVKTAGIVVHVYDGDTCKIVIPFKHY